MGADTFGHIAEACTEGGGDRAGLRAGPLYVPNLDRLGFGAAAEASRGAPLPDLGHSGPPEGRWGYGVEVSQGKDTPSGHWEIAGVPVPFAWGYFPETIPTFPKELTDALIREAKLPGILGNKHASGTEIIAELGEEHVRTGKPICYTSADSVFQIAAHETAFGLDRLYEVCEIARRLVDPLNIGRVIARPFIGNDRRDFKRTANRRDYAVPPPGADAPRPRRRRRPARHRHRQDRGHLRPSRHQRGDEGAERQRAVRRRCLLRSTKRGDGDLVFANFVDFDTLYGHRRDVPGYAAALEAFDRRLPELEAKLKPGDLVVITADHGNDPTFRGTDHTREHVPIVAFGPGVGAGVVGRRAHPRRYWRDRCRASRPRAGRHGRSFLRHPLAAPRFPTPAV